MFKISEILLVSPVSCDTEQGVKGRNVSDYFWLVSFADRFLTFRFITWNIFPEFNSVKNGRSSGGNSRE